MIRSLNKKTMDPGHEDPGAQLRGCGVLFRPLPKRRCLQVAPTPCNSNSMWKCPLVPVGLLLSGVGASPRGGGDQQTSRDLHGCALRPRMAKGNGLSVGC